MSTSYYVQIMTEHYFPLKIPTNSNTTTSFSPEKQPRGTCGLGSSTVTSQWRLMLIPLTSHFLNFNFTQLAMNGSLYLRIFIVIDKSNAI